MSLFHDSVEWKKDLAKLISQLTPGENIPYETFQKFIEFFNKPAHTWKIPASKRVEAKQEDTNVTSETSALTEQIVLEETRQYLWYSFYKRLVMLDYEKGEVFNIQHSPLDYPDFKDSPLQNEEYPPNTIIYEAVQLEEAKYIRIWSVVMPNVAQLVFDEGESFTQYYEYAKLHVPKLDEYVHSEEDLFQVIVAEKERHGNACYATVAGQRDIQPCSILYFYWATDFFFSAELFLEEENASGSLHFNPHIYPYPVQYCRARNFRKFRYLKENDR